MGGVYYCPQGLPHVWRYPFPAEVQSKLVSSDNRTGVITNSDLEHAGLLGQVMLIADNHPVAYATISSRSDNTPAVSRLTKGAVSSESTAAHLCNVQCSHQREHRYLHEAAYLAGHLNVMADDASCMQQLTDSAFLAHFEQAYP